MFLLILFLGPVSKLASGEDLTSTLSWVSEVGKLFQLLLREDSLSPPPLRPPTRTRVQHGAQHSRQSHVWEQLGTLKGSPSPGTFAPSVLTMLPPLNLLTTASPWPGIH